MYYDHRQQYMYYGHVATVHALWPAKIPNATQPNLALLEQRSFNADRYFGQTVVTERAPWLVQLFMYVR